NFQKLKQKKRFKSNPRLRPASHNASRSQGFSASFLVSCVAEFSRPSQTRTRNFPNRSPTESLVLAAYFSFSSFPFPFSSSTPATKPCGWTILRPLGYPLPKKRQAKYGRK